LIRAACALNFATDAKPQAQPTRRGALELLAGSRDGVPEALMLAHGFSIELLVELVHAGLATASSERTAAGRHPVEVTRVRITDAGRSSRDAQSHDHADP
jgi:hypothetical protein